MLRRWLARRQPWPIGEPAVPPGRTATETVETAAQLRFLRLLLDTVEEAIVGTDPEGRITFWSRAAVGLYGWEAAEVIGRPLHEIAPLPAPLPTGEDVLRQLLDGQRWSGELTATSRDGRSFPIRFTGSALRDAEGSLIGIVGISADITDRKETERALIEAVYAADAANRAKSEFLATMSHELRTPLNAILGFSEIMRNGLLGPLGSPRYQEFIDHIHVSGEDLLATIDKVLQLASIEADRLSLRDEIVGIGALLEERRRSAQEAAERAGVAIVLERADDLPALLGDRRALGQALDNLLSNAIKFTPTGGRVLIRGGREEGGGIAIRIEDTGIGIAPLDIPRVLEPFGQVERSFSRTYRGSGLGLPISRALVEAHGGRLELVSEPARGTAVTVRLPPTRIVE